jgi:hypothetical protein
VELTDLIEALQREHFHISNHADEEAKADILSFEEIIYSVMQGEIIEDYPTDRPFPSCLILGWTFSGQPVHSVWAYNATKKWAVLITVYRPDPQRWFEWRKRRPK